MTMNKLEALTEVLKVKFMYNGIKVNGKLYGGHWSNGPYVAGNEGLITFYASGYEKVPNGIFEVENDSDIMTDYFVNDIIRFYPDKPYYLQAVNAHLMFKEKADKRHQAYLIRNGVTV